MLLLAIQDSTSTCALEYAMRWLWRMRNSPFGLPDIVVMENPPGLRTVKEAGTGEATMKRLYAEIKKLGYCSVSHRDVHCASFGDPTQRVRCAMWAGKTCDVRHMSLPQVGVQPHRS
jgi:site-specific DNA-cytosine methylase